MKWGWVGGEEGGRMRDFEGFVESEFADETRGIEGEVRGKR